jgi:ATP-dependent RNA helicase DeaD
MEGTKALDYTFSPSLSPGRDDAPGHEHPEDVVENEQDTSGISRGQNQLHLLPEDSRAATTVIEPLLDRVEAGTPGLQLLVVTSDSDAAAAIAGRMAPAATLRGLRLLAATDARRAARVQRSKPAQIVVAPARVLVELLQSAVLKVGEVRAVALAYVDAIDSSGVKALESLMSELPKDAARLVIANSVTPTVEQLVERYARRARRVQPVSPETAPVSLSYVAGNESTRAQSLRRILDAVDPESAFVVARSAESRTIVEALLRSLGYGADSDVVRVGETPDTTATLVILFDLPANEQELRRVVSERPSARVIALVTPRQIAALRVLAGSTISPFVLPEAAARARAREEGLKDELRAMLATGQFSRELLALESLLSEYDGAEIAAAALRLLEAERAKPQTPAAAIAQPLTRLYVNVGSMDNVRPGDLVGAITNEAGISKAELGKVDVRERHSTVEVATPVANTVVAKLTGVSIRGRRVIARVDEEREVREQPQRPRRDDMRVGSRDTRRKR